MSFYLLALFAHILGVLGVFVGIALDWVTILRLRRAQAMSLVREVTSLVGFQARLIQISSLLLLIAGISMTVTTWGWRTPWILLSLVALIVMGALSGGVNGRRLTAIRKAADCRSCPLDLSADGGHDRVGGGLSDDHQAGLARLADCARGGPRAGVISAQPWRLPRKGRALVKEAQPGS